MDTKRSSEAAGKHQSLWTATVDVPVFAALSGHTSADVCVVGAGISGLTTAYLLAKAGKSVVVLDDGPIGGGASGVTTAHLSNAVDDRYVEIERLHGADGARLVAESHTAAIQQIASILADERISCDFAWLDGYLLLAPGTDERLLDQELAAAIRAGVPDVARVSGSPLPGWAATSCLRFGRQARFHPLKYLAGLALALERLGGRISTGTHADEISGGKPGRVRAGRHTVEAAHIVVATNSPINDRLVMHTKQAGYMTYVIGARIPRGSVPDALYWDTGQPYHYLRLQPDVRGLDGRDLLIVGGEDHKTGQDDAVDTRHLRLEAWARERFPALETVEFRWAGQVMEPVDGVAFIGRNPLDDDNVFIITGDSGMGMTHGTIGGILLRDLITGKENRWASLYDPSRKTIKAAGTYLREAANMAAQYADWLTEGEIESVAALAPGEGAILRQGLKKVAAYRDARGEVHECSAVCPHLGGIVRWNATEKTWDCPCHGSRFDALGTVISGPANRNLSPIARKRELEV